MKAFYIIKTNTFIRGEIMKKILKETIEYHSYKRGLAILLAVFIGLIVLSAIPFLVLYIQNGNQQLLHAFTIFFIIDIMLCLPFIIFFIFRMHIIKKVGSEMKVKEVELNDFESSIYGLMFFFINVPDKNGVIMRKRSLCSMRGKLFNEYKNAKVKVFYKDEYGYFFIIKKGGIYEK